MEHISFEVQLCIEIYIYQRCSPTKRNDKQRNSSNETKRVESETNPSETKRMLLWVETIGVRTETKRVQNETEPI